MQYIKYLHIRNRRAPDNDVEKECINLTAWQCGGMSSSNSSTSTSTTPTMTTTSTIVWWRRQQRRRRRCSLVKDGRTVLSWLIVVKMYRPSIGFLFLFCVRSHTHACCMRSRCAIYFVCQVNALTHTNVCARTPIAHSKYVDERKYPHWHSNTFNCGERKITILFGETNSRMNRVGTRE